MNLCEALGIPQALETTIYLWEALGEAPENEAKGYITTLADIYRMAIENGINPKELAKSSELWQNLCEGY